ncbi:Rni-like superfamily protein [Thalictrum thalictroides]|uniref:Rni-like superfamily protein n=1 Tax=Thalictrum thalictroides TaxID=46969 RepID=A0A7J6WAB5_THATH|nr:Rni-like superfamily protein [Thalictrum thalictroides]
MVVSVARKAEFFDFDNAGKPMNVCPKSRRACLVVLPTDQRIQGTASSSKQEERPPHEQVITLFNVIQQVKIYPCQLKELAELQKLRKLNINVGNDAVVAEEDLSQLQRFKTLRVLTIRWGGVVHSTPKESSSLKRAATMTMDYLSMPPNLEKLDLQCFPHEVSPKWLRSSNLKNLKRLYIKGGKLGSLKNEAGDEAWNVKILRLKFLIDMVMNWSDMLSKFPHMVYLEKIKCDKLEFPCDKNGVWPDETR